MMAYAFLSLLVLPAAYAGHNDMFSCRGKSCDVTELTEANWASTIAETPHFVMFYAPWCGHCKQLAPKLKNAAKKAKAMGFGIGAVDVEPNPSIQQMFPDIRGFPSLKYVNNAKGKKSVDYNGPREGEDILQWTKEMFVKTGGVPAEPIEDKKWSELYTAFGRAALDGKPVLFAVGGASEPPPWLGKLHGDLKEAPKDDKGPSPEAETKRLLGEAKRATKLPEVREGIVGVLETLEMAEKAKGKKAKPLFSTTYSSDAATVAAFNATGASKDAAHVYALFLDRKDLSKSLVVAYPGNPVAAKRGKIDAAPVLAFGKTAAGAASGGTFKAEFGSNAVPLPDVPKPKSVLAAEERAAARKAREAAVSSVNSAADLEAYCYGLASSKTCVLGVGAADNELAPLAAKYAREGFAFASVAADAPVAEAFLAGGAVPALVVVKGGKRPRAARAHGADAFAGLLDNVVGGGASFAKFKEGLPAWPVEEAAAEEEGDEYDL